VRGIDHVRERAQAVIRTVTPATICERAARRLRERRRIRCAGRVIDASTIPSFGLPPDARNSACLSLNLGRGELALGAHIVEVENRSTPLIRSGAATINVVTGRRFAAGRIEPGLLERNSKGVRPVVNVTGHVVSARLVEFATSIPVDVVEVPVGSS